MAETYSIDVIVKPYVRRYLINNCGNPVDLSRLPRFQFLFRRLLRKPLFRFESLKMPSNSSYVRILISNDTFYRYGWEMTLTNMMTFNSEIEREIKFIMRTHITYRTAMGYSVAKCIRDFQRWFDMPEDVWSYEAIKKDLFRNTESKRNKDVETFLDQMDQKFQKIFLENLSSLGTISKKYKNEISQV